MAAVVQGMDEAVVSKYRVSITFTSLDVWLMTLRNQQMVHKSSITTSLGWQEHPAVESRFRGLSTQHLIFVALSSRAG
jgi:hypothetical protein